jgi:hypothetical protein
MSVDWQQASEPRGGAPVRILDFGAKGRRQARPAANGEGRWSSASPEDGGARPGSTTLEPELDASGSPDAGGRWDRGERRGTPPGPAPPPRGDSWTCSASLEDDGGDGQWSLRRTEDDAGGHGDCVRAGGR